MSSIDDTSIGRGDTDKYKSFTTSPQTASKIDPDTDKKYNLYKSKEDDTITVNNIDELDASIKYTDKIIDELGASIKYTDKINVKLFNRQSYDKTKKIIDNFRNKLANYPDYISYEGSMVICVMLSLHPKVKIPMISLPQVDQKFINSHVIDKEFKPINYIIVKFDEIKDFIIQIPPRDFSREILPLSFTFFNTVAHPRPEDLEDISQVTVEEKGGIINVGDGTIVVDKKRMADLAAVPQKPDIQSSWKQHESTESSIIKTTNKNAYELRTEILKMALDYIGNGRSWPDFNTPDKVLDVAKTFYTFVENKRR